MTVYLWILIGILLLLIYKVIKQSTQISNLERKLGKLRHQRDFYSQARQESLLEMTDLKSEINRIQKEREEDKEHYQKTVFANKKLLEEKEFMEMEHYTSLWLDDVPSDEYANEIEVEVKFLYPLFMYLGYRNNYIDASTQSSVI